MCCIGAHGIKKEAADHQSTERVHVAVPSRLCSLREARKGSTLSFFARNCQIRVVQSSSLLPSNRNRSTFVHALVTSLGLLRRCSGSHPPENSTSHQLTVLRPSPASRLDLTSYHDRSYIDTLLADPPGPDPASCKEFGLEDVTATPILSVVLMLTFGAQDCPPFPGLKEYVLGIAGASLTAARELAEGRSDIAICWDGGRSVQSHFIPTFR